MRKLLAIITVLSVAGIIADNTSIAAELSFSELDAGGRTWGDNNNSSIESQAAKFVRAGTENYFRNANPPSGISGASSGEFDMEWDVVSADWTNTAGLDQKATWALGIRGAGSQDAMLRIMYEGQLNITNINVNGVTNIYADADQIALMVNDKDNTWREAAVFPGSSIANLHLRINYNLFDGTMDFYYTPDGGSETNFYSGFLYDEWAISTYRIAAQFDNGGSIWEVGDELFIDNITFTQIQEPFAPPPYALVDLWDYEGLTNGAALSEALSTGFVGSVSFSDASMCSITNLPGGNGALKFTATGVANESVFRARPPSLYGGSTTGIYEFAFDVPYVDWSLTQGVSSNANIGFEIRDSSVPVRAVTLLMQYNAGADEIRLNYTDLNGTVTMGTIPGAIASNAGMRCVFDLDNSGNAGSAQFYFKKDGVEAASTYSGTIPFGFDFTQYRLRAQALNGGNGWQIGDIALMDNLRVEKIAAMPEAPVYTDRVVYEMNDLSGVSLAGLSQTGPDSGQFDADEPNMLTDGAGSLTVAGTGTNDAYRVHTLDVAYTSGLHRLEFAFDDWDLDATENGSSLKFGFQDETGDNNVVFGIDVNTNNGTVRFRAAANNGGGAGQVLYDHAGYVASTGVVLRIDVDLDAGFYNAFFRYDNQIDDDFVTVVGGGAIALDHIADIRLAFNTANTTGMDPADFVDVDYLRYGTTSDQVPPTPTELYVEWLDGYPALGADTNLGDNADGDIYDNLAEYYYGGDPTVGESISNAPALGDVISDGGTNYILYVYARRQDAADRGLSNMIELATDLMLGDWANDTSLYDFVGAVNIDDTWRSITNRVNAEADERFIRNVIEFTP
jgi:hypothetical protein